ISNVKQETVQVPVFSLTRHPGSLKVELRTGDEDPVHLPLVSRGDFTMHWWVPYELQTVPPKISFLLSSDPPSADEDFKSESDGSSSSEMRQRASSQGSLTFDHGKVKERTTFTYGWQGVEEDACMTWLHVFSLLPGYHPVVKLLLAQGADPNSVDTFFEQTPLHLASTPETVRVLIENKAEVDAKDRLNRHSIVGVLVAHGADLLAADKERRTPLSEAKTEEVILTIIHTRDMNGQDHETGNTLLHFCCERGYEEAAKRLIEKGARLDVTNKEGKTALDVACAKGFAHIAYLFHGHLQTGRFEREFEVVKDDKHKDGQLGKGAFGRVFKARRRGTDDVFAIKEIHFPPEDAEKTLREVRAVTKLSKEREGILAHHDAWLEDRRTSDEGTTSTQGGDGHELEALPSPSGRRADIDPRKGSSDGEESNGCSRSPGEERNDGNVVGHSERKELQQPNRNQTATTEEGESSQRPSPSTAEGRGGGVRLPQGSDQSNESQDESCDEEGSESPSCTDEESDVEIVFANSGEETGQSNKNQQRETSGEEGSSDRPPSLAGESDDDVTFQDSESGQDTDHDESSAEGDFSGSSSPSQEGSDDGIRFEEIEEIGRNSRTQDESRETSSPSQEDSDDGIRFEETEETGPNDQSQDAISFNEGESRQDNQRSPSRGNEEESDEPPTRSSAQDGDSESVWTSGAEAQGDGSESVWTSGAEEYLRKCTFTLYIQMDLMEMTLEDYIRRRNEEYLEKKSYALSCEDRRTAGGIFGYLCWAVDWVHKSRFIHRDLKPSNVLLSRIKNRGRFDCPYSVRLSDFGLSTRLVDEFGAEIYKTVGCGTVSYAAPEQLKGGPGSTSKGAKYGREVDVYSLALIFVELWMPMSESERVRVFDGLRCPDVRIPKEVEESFDDDDVRRVVRALSPEDERTERPLVQLRRALSHDPTERPTARDLHVMLCSSNFGYKMPTTPHSDFDHEY
ncbi:unnamed protein product, partial [Cyprideis torosa]